MIQDKQLIYSAAQAETTAAAHDSTNTVDATKAGDAEPTNLVLVVQVNTTATSGGAATVVVQFQTSADNSTWVTLIQTDAIPVATLAAGYVIIQANIPRALLRYSKVVYTIGTAALTAGKFDAFLTPNAQTQFNQ